jgi:hypothetical protein
MHALQPRDPATVHFCSWCLHAVVEGEIDPQLTGTALSTPPMICEFELLHSKRYWPTGILIHRQNSYVPHSRRCTGRREEQSYEPVNKGKNLRVYEELSDVLRLSLFLVWRRK